MNHSFLNIPAGSSMEFPTLFLPGWGFDGRLLKLFSPRPEWIVPQETIDPSAIVDDLLRLVAEQKLKKFNLIGWSMGSMLALDLAVSHPELVASLTLVALRDHWPPDEIKAIREEFSHDPESFCKSFYRKCFLGAKETYRSFQDLIEPSYITDIKKNYTRLNRGLNYLERFKVETPLPAMPVRLIHGRQDIIVPIEEMAVIPGAETEIIDNAGHAVLLHEGCSLQIGLKKQVIRQKFSRAAETYDTYALVQKEAAAHLAARLPGPDATPGVRKILEIGCGTGNYTAMLTSRFPEADIDALDFSPEMIAAARGKLDQENINFICADGEQYLAETPVGSFDLVTSNGSLQWFGDIEKTLADIARVLSSGGTAACSIFGPESLKELGEGLQAVLDRKDENLAARSFPSLEKLQEILTAVFVEAHLEEEAIIREYNSAHDLLLHIKKTGTSGFHRKIIQPLTASRFDQLDTWFAKNHGGCRVTYQILFLQGKK